MKATKAGNAPNMVTGKNSRALQRIFFIEYFPH